MRGTALLLLCAITAQAAQPQLTLSGKVCNCNAAEAPSVCSQNGSDNELIVHENCNQFYKCTHGKPIPYYCPDTTLYNPLAELCDWPHNVVCGDRPIVAPGDGSDGADCSQEDSNNGNDGNGQDNGGSDNGSGGTCNCNPGEAPGICAADGSDGVLVAHENCNQFYKCSYGVPVALNCSAGLLYNPYTEQCDWPFNVECGDRPIVEIDGGDNGGTDNGGTDNGGTDNGGTDNGGTDNGGGTCNCNPGEAPGICAADGSDGVLVAHENCNQFYKCDNGVPVTLNCPAGLLYNPYTEQCDWPHKVECGDRPIVEIEGGGDSGGDVDCEDTGNGNGESGEGNGDNGGGDNGGGGTCNCNPGEAPGICAADGSDGTLVAHENCNQFYKCDHGVPVTINCPPGLVYNPYIECCDWPYNVDCGDKPIVEVDGGGNGGSDGNNSNEGGNGDNGGGNGGNSNEDNGPGTCNCNPEQAPEICSADGSDGTLVAHENCNQFYKCDHGVPVTVSCPPGLVYNPYIECCDWPANVDCGDKPIVEVDGGGNGDNGGGDGSGENGSGGGNNGENSNENGGGTCNCNPGEAPGICAADGSDGVLVAHENCNQFYKCSYGVPVALNCPAGLLYNPYTKQCDWPFNVECGDRPIVEIDGGDNGGTDNGGTDNGGTDNGGTDNGGTDNGGGTCNCNPGEAPGICAADGSDGVLVAHENCNQFYKCDNGVPVTLNCPAGLLYNPYTEQCDWPHKVECGDRPIVEIEGGGDSGGDVDCEDTGNGNGESGEGNGDNGGGDNGGGGTCNCNPGEAPGICAADGSDGTLVAHENCNQFYKCDHGVPVTINCPPGLVYNPYIECCDWPYNVDCGDKPIVEVDGGGNGGSDGNNSNEGGNGDNGGGNGGNSNEDNGPGTCNCNPEQAPEICSADGSDGTLVAHENCNQFYKCDHGVPVTVSCPPGLVYNPYIECCDWPANVDCGDKPIVEVDGGGNGDNGGGDGSGENGSGGGNNGENSNENGGGTCNCNPGEAPGICAADGSDGVLVAHENCNQFYKCSYGVPVALNCPAGLLYNPYTKQCDWPFNVECGDRPIVEIDGADNGGTETGGTDNGGTDNGGTENGGTDNGGTDNGNGDGNSSCNCNPEEASGICARPGSDGQFVAHENCNQFYQCAHGVPVCNFCPGVLLYNPYLQRCDWPQNVDCGDRPIVENDGGSEDNGNTDSDSDESDNDSGDNEVSCNCNPEEAPGICSAPGSDGTLVAHNNCNQYYVCAHGLPVAVFCSNGLVYDPYSGRCNWPSAVDCGNRPIVENEGNGGDSDNGSSEGGEVDGDTCDPSQAPSICAAPGSDGILVAHENCNQFYVCTHGAPFAFSCPSNLLFNSVIRDCDWPHNVDCGDRVIPEPDSGDNDGPCNCNAREAPSICAGSESNGKMIAHENCSQYYVCFEGVPVARSCPRTLLYEPHSEQCLWPASVSCEERSVTTYFSLNKHAQARRGIF